MDYSDEQILELVPKGDLRAIARMITLSENRVPRALALQAKLFAHTGQAHVVGVTGPPGAGKSTLVDQLALRFRAGGKKVAIVAVDPSSPFSGGAVLGDRIRMTQSVEFADVFIRSMATRGSLGGLSNATADAIRILDAAKYDLIIIETVGVGQAEVDIVKTADTCVLVLVPGMGDSVQAIKAGVMEIADLFVINKADRPGADILQRDLRLILSLGPRPQNAWELPILKSTATSGEGSDDIAAQVQAHKRWLAESNEGAARRLSMIRANILKIAAEQMFQGLVLKDPERLDTLCRLCVEKKKDPYTAALEFIS